MIGMKTKIKAKEKYDFETMVLILILALVDNCLYLVNVESIEFGPVKYSDIVLGIYIFFGIYILRKYRNEKAPNYRFKFICLFTIVLVLASSITTWRLFGQSIIFGIRPQRSFLISYLMYFIMAKYFYISKENYYKFEKAVYITGTLALFLYTIQYVLANVKLFLYITPTVRYGEVRLMFATNLIPVFTFVVFSNLLNGKDKKKNSILFFFLLVYFLVVSKTRLMVLGLGLAIIILYIIWKRNLLLKLGFTFIALSLMFILVRFPLFNNYLSVLDSNVRKADGNYIVRVKGKAYYKSQLEKSPILGRGYPNELYKKSIDACQMDKGYFLLDNGLIGFEYIYGLVGVLWLFALFAQMFIYSYKKYKYQNNYAMMGYVIFCAGIISNIIQLYWGWGSFYTGMILGVLENTSKEDEI